MVIYLENVIQFAEIKLKIITDTEIPVSEELKKFIVEEDGAVQCFIHVNNDWENSRHPSSLAIGDDLIQSYYKEENQWFCELKGGDKGPISCTSYTEDYYQFNCSLNQKKFKVRLDVLNTILRMLPMRAIFIHFDTIFFHASQVIIRNKGILFTAPSGTGKTTQAKLWERYMHAKIACNDRTLVRKRDGCWYTYGYPLDGSEPIASNEKNLLGAIVILKQGKENKFEKLSLSKKVALLMEQIVLDAWNAREQEKAISLLLTLIQEIPVYLYACTPDENAVKVLKQRLLLEGVIDS